MFVTDGLDPEESGASTNRSAISGEMSSMRPMPKPIAQNDSKRSSSRETRVAWSAVTHAADRAAIARSIAPPSEAVTAARVISIRRHLHKGSGQAPGCSSTAGATTC